MTAASTAWSEMTGGDGIAEGVFEVFAIVLEADEAVLDIGVGEGFGGDAREEEAAAGDLGDLEGDLAELVLGRLGIAEADHV